MKKFFLKTGFLIMLFVFPLGAVYADRAVGASQEKSYFVRVTSSDPNVNVNFVGENIQETSSGPKIYMMNDVTPFEGVFTTNSLNLMLHLTSNTAPKIKIEIMDTENYPGQVLVSGIGKSVFVHVSKFGGSYTNSIN